MLLAELQLWHTRPVTPTRRIALGHLVLPTDPAPGLGGVLLAAVVAAYLPDVDEELHPDIGRLIDQVVRGERVVQPRLQHRYQIDRHGLATSVHQLNGDADHVEFDLHSMGRPLSQVLGAIYALERLAFDARCAGGGPSGLRSWPTSRGSAAPIWSVSPTRESGRSTCSASRWARPRSPRRT